MQTWLQWCSPAWITPGQTAAWKAREMVPLKTVSDTYKFWPVDASQRQALKVRWRYNRFRSQKPRRRLNCGSYCDILPLQMWWGKQKNPNCMDGLLIHRDQEPSRPIWNREKVKQTSAVLLEYYQHLISFQAPMWRERQEALQWTRWKAVERERQSTALPLTVDGVVEGFVPENRGQKVDIIGHFGETVF